ncbi:uncharacterized protein LOC110674159 [Aedes aegypti]|uniref:F-box domain-containing protein n=2 Tax=Aedes aegypti TaxID=7159 RepID=A0A903VJW0_AEDAE|nr:uncharacterized protein LOC110674159 [Aedes aegypti]
MSLEVSKMYSETSIEDLPDEMLEQILLFLTLDDRRSALRVCRRWSTLKPFDWSSVQLVVDFARNTGQEACYHQTLLASTRQYKHLVFYFGYDSDKYDLLVDILQHFCRKLETLKLIPNNFVPVKLKLFAQITALCSNLRHLHIDACNFDFNRRDLEFSPMHKLEELYLENNLLSLIPNMRDITPNITRLHMQISFYSEESRLFLRHFSLQLVELGIWFLSEDYFLTVCEMQFPLLEKLNFYCVDLEIDPGGSFAEVELIDLFFHQLPLLKEVTLRCNLDDRVIRNLCRSCVKMQFLCVSMDYFLQDSFRAICELKHLKRLRIEEAAVNVPTDLYTPLKSLQKLSLYSTRIVHQEKFNSFVQGAFPNLAVMELLHLTSRTNEGRSFELHGNICSNIPSLQRLVLSEPTSNIKLGTFLEFCASHAPKELRFKCWSISGVFPEDESPRKIPVQKLILDSPLISPSVLQKLIGSMGELRWLELALADYCSPEVISSLREQFPRCYVVAKRKVPIEEPL